VKERLSGQGSGVETQRKTAPGYRRTLHSLWSCLISCWRQSGLSIPLAEWQSPRLALSFAVSYFVLLGADRHEDRSPGMAYRAVLMGLLLALFCREACVYLIGTLVLFVS